MVILFLFSLFFLFSFDKTLLPVGLDSHLPGPMSLPCLYTVSLPCCSRGSWIADMLQDGLDEQPLRGKIIVLLFCLSLPH